MEYLSGREARDAHARYQARRQNDAGEENDTVNPTNPTPPSTPRTPDTNRPEPTQQPPDQSNLPNRNRRGTADVPAQDGGSSSRPGATESETGDRRGPAVGYNQEPQREEDEGGVS